MRRPLSTGLITNEGFINALNQNLDLKDLRAVFRYVFAGLNDHVVVYPTENHYYFQFPSPGGTVCGSLGLYAHDRDQGVLTFGYVEKDDRLQPKNVAFRGNGCDLTAKEGVIVKKVHDFLYNVTFEGRTVAFQLNDLGLAPPHKAKLLEDEVFVGPSYDESGLRFFLFFNKTQSHLYWILNEDVYVPERFDAYAKDIVIGRRTQFAFYLDDVNSRKILIGAEATHVINNTWFDGPFDHMPDNYVYTGQIETKKYIEASYPEAKGRIDKYGYFLGRRGARVPVANYRVYYDKAEFRLVDACRVSTHSPSEFYTCITQQVYNPPNPDPKP
ncbi:MAG: hypothetical protein HY232_20720 [Acidobacteria bacterium]|nr:hypothetical protein [Acidobacteriota bacterium]